MISSLNKDLKDDLLDVCMRIVDSHDTHMVAACLYGAQASGYSKEKANVDTLLVLRRFRSGLASYQKPIGDTEALILTVDSRAFEKDVKQGWLGEFVADKILIPYEPLFNKDYLWRQEVLLKRRIIWELLENIVLGFPESSYELIIKPEYFLYETIMQRSKLFPPVTFRFLNMLRNETREGNVNQMMRGFSQALKELAEEKWINLYDEHAKITRKFINAIRSKRIRVPPFLRSVQRAAFLHVFNVLPKMMSPLKREEEIFMKTHREFRNEDLTFQLEDPKKYLFMPTPLGPVPLSDETTIEEFVRKNVPSGEKANIQINEIGRTIVSYNYILGFAVA